MLTLNKFIRLENSLLFASPLGLINNAFGLFLFVNPFKFLLNLPEQQSIYHFKL